MPAAARKRPRTARAGRAAKGGWLATQAGPSLGFRRGHAGRPEEATTTGVGASAATAGAR